MHTEAVITKLEDALVKLGSELEKLRCNALTMLSGSDEMRNYFLIKELGWDEKTASERYKREFHNFFYAKLEGDYEISTTFSSGIRSNLHRSVFLMEARIEMLERQLNAGKTGNFTEISLDIANLKRKIEQVTLENQKQMERYDAEQKALLSQMQEEPDVTLFFNHLINHHPLISFLQVKANKY